MRCILVSHTHWDREWYKTFQSFRARLVDTVDRVLELVEADPDFRFQLDGQAIVLEDYLAIRPEKRETLAAAMAAGRVAAGPWYVQPDSLIPTGETHVRNLLEGRRVTETLGPCSRIAYTPDSFGHPAQFPQLFAGFGLGPFIYWRGNADEIKELPADYTWQAPDGSRVTNSNMAKGYFPAWGLNEDVDLAVKRLKPLARALAARSERDTVLLMNGIDHMLPDDNTREVAEALAKATGWQVERGLLDQYSEGLPESRSGEEAPSAGALAVFEGELIGGHLANLLPGVWSTHAALKIANRRCEALLQGWAEPFAALALALGTQDERAALRLGWRALLPTQAHDSICGCSQDRVHLHMATRFDEIADLAEQTTERLLERLCGLGTTRQLPQTDPEEGLSIAVFNPTPQTRTDRVRLALDGFPAYTKQGIHPLLLANARIHQGSGFTVDGVPGWIRTYEGTVRPGLAPGQAVHDLEFVAKDVPAFGWKRMTLRQATPVPPEVDALRLVWQGEGAERVAVEVLDDGRLRLELGGQQWHGLFGFEAVGDRGDTYDFDPVPGDIPIGERTALERIEVERRRHENGLSELEVRGQLEVPAGLAEDRASRRKERVALPVVLTACLVRGVPRLDVRLQVDNRASDHRLRVLFALAETQGEPVAFEAATTFGTAARTNAPRDDSAWIHTAPTTFPSQGWVSLGGLTVAAPGLLESEVLPDGQLAVTLLRATGWLSRPDLSTRPGEAGPSLPTPLAQVPGPLEAKFHLFAADPTRNEGTARAAELGLVAVGAGQAPPSPPDTPLLCLETEAVELSALKPAEDGDGLILRLLNTGPRSTRARVRFAPVLAQRIRAVTGARLDESPASVDMDWSAPLLQVDVRAAGLVSLRLRLDPETSRTRAA